MTNQKRSVGRPALSPEELQSRKRVILDEALALVATRGADAVRLRDVSEAAGVSIGTLQYYFESRDQLIREAFTQHAHGVVESVVSGSDSVTDPWKRIVAMFHAVASDPHFNQRCALWVEFAAASLHDHQLRVLMASAYEGWREPLKDAVAAGVRSKLFRPSLPTDTVVSCLLALIDGLEVAVALEVRGTNPSTVFKELKDAARVLLGGPRADDGVNGGRNLDR